MKRNRKTLSPFAQWLVELTEELDISLTALAKQAGVAPGTLRYLLIEPERKPSLETCLRLSAVSGKPMQEILALNGGTEMGQIDPYHPDRLRLMSVFDGLSPDGRIALLKVAEAMATVIKSNQTLGK